MNTCHCFLPVLKPRLPSGRGPSLDNHPLGHPDSGLRPGPMPVGGIHVNSAMSSASLRISASTLATSVETAFRRGSWRGGKDGADGHVCEISGRRAEVIEVLWKSVLIILAVVAAAAIFAFAQPKAAEPARPDPAWMRCCPAGRHCRTIPARRWKRRRSFPGILAERIEAAIRN